MKQGRYLPRATSYYNCEILWRQARLLLGAKLMFSGPLVNACPAHTRPQRRIPVHRPQGADMKQPTIARRALMGTFASAFLSAVIAVPMPALADEGGVSFWIPGFFG